jgi:sn-glycerol 3-phosphate transport system permease protein
VAAVGVPLAGADDAPTPIGRRRRDWLLTLLLLAPSAAVFGVFVFYPLGRTIWLGLHQSDPFGISMNYVGFEGYTDVLGSDDFRKSLWVTVKYALMTVPTGLVLGLGLAVLAHRQLRGMRLFRTIFSSTVATSVAVAALMWLTLLHPSIGGVNQVLDAVGIEPIAFLQRPGWALVSVSAATVWQNLGFVFIVISAGLGSIPDELLESARVDGAGPWRRFREITLPLLSPTLLFAFVVLMIRAFQSFGEVDILTQGGPLRSTQVLVFDVFEKTSSDPSRAAAEAVVLFVIVLALTIVQLRVLERRVHYAA